MLPACAQVLDRKVAMAIAGMKKSGFEAAEAKVPGAGGAREGEGNGRRVAGKGELFDLGAAGVGKPQECRHLVKGFPYGVILALAQEFHFEGVDYSEKVGVPSCGHEHQEGVCYGLLSEFQGGDMGLEVVYAYEGKVMGGGQRPSEGKAD